MLRGAPILKFTMLSNLGRFYLKGDNTHSKKQFFTHGAEALALLRAVSAPHLEAPKATDGPWAVWAVGQAALTGGYRGAVSSLPPSAIPWVCDSMVLITASWKFKPTSKFFMVPHQLHPRVTQCTLSSEISLLMAASPKAWKANTGRKSPGQHAFLGQELSDCVEICST